MTTNMDMADARAGLAASAEAQAAVIDLTPQAVEDPAEMALMDELTEAARLPEWAAKRMHHIADLRRYLEDDVYEIDNDSSVNLNALGRMLSAKVGQMWPERPMCILREQTRSVAPQADTEREMHRLWTKVAAQLVNWFADKALLEDDMQAALYDALVDGVVWVKAEWVEDTSRDPLGTPRMDDAQDQLALLRQLAAQAASGEITGSSPEWAQLRELVAYYQRVQAHLAQRQDPRAGALGQALEAFPPRAEMLPEPMHFAGLAVTLVPVENLRLDWEQVTTLEALHRGRRMIEVAWLDDEEIATRYQLDEEDRRALRRGVVRSGGSRPEGMRSGSGGPDEDPKDRDAEDEEHGSLRAVYCCWDRSTRQRYTWTPGLRRWLDKQEWTGKFPFVPIALSKTPKRPIPISIGLGGWKLQMEINQTLTEGKAARRARFPRYVGKRGAVDPADIRKITGAVPHAYVEVDEPDEVKKALEAIQGVEYDPRLYDVASLLRLLEMEVGVTMQQIGLSSSGSTATEVERAEAGAQTTSAMHASLLHKALRRVYELALGYIAEYVGPEQVAWILGPAEAQIWAAYPQGREQIAAGLKVDILAAAHGPSAMQAQAEAWMQTADALARVAQSKVMLAQAGEALNTAPIYEAITEGMGLSVAGDELVQPLPPPPPDTPGMGGGGEAANQALALAGSPG